MKPKKTFLLIAVLIMVYGDLLYAQSEPSVKKIKIIALIKDTITHTHLGITIFENKTNYYNFGESVKNYLYQQTRYAFQDFQISGTNKKFKISELNNFNIRKYPWLREYYRKNKAEALKNELKDSCDILIIVRNEDFYDKLFGTLLSIRDYGIYTCGKYFYGIAKQWHGSAVVQMPLSFEIIDLHTDKKINYFPEDDISQVYGKAQEQKGKTYELKIKFFDSKEINDEVLNKSKEIIKTLIKRQIESLKKSEKFIEFLKIN